MSPEQMRAEIRKAYDGPFWKNKVDNMPESQVKAVYFRMLNAGSLKGA